MGQGRRDRMESDMMLTGGYIHGWDIAKNTRQRGSVSPTSTTDWSDEDFVHGEIRIKVTGKRGVGRRNVKSAPRMIPWAPSAALASSKSVQPLRQALL